MIEGSVKIQRNMRRLSMTVDKNIIDPILGENKKTELEKQIYIDLQVKIYHFFDSQDVKYKNKENPEDTISDFFSYLYTQIPPVKRKVYCSKELKNKIDSGELDEKSIKVLKQYQEAFEAGKNMGCFLSSKSKDVRKPDFFLYTWHLYHLHMSGKFVDDPKQMKNNRSDTQLVCIVDNENIYFVDVIHHPKKPAEYFNFRLLEIIVDNGWIEKIGFCRCDEIIPGSLEPKITEGIDFFELYSKGRLNVGFEFRDKCYIPLEQISTSLKPYFVTHNMCEINRNIFKANKINGEYKGVEFGKYGNELLLLAHFILNNENEIHYDLISGKHFRRFIR